MEPPCWLIMYTRNGSCGWLYYDLKEREKKERRVQRDERTEGGMSKEDENSGDFLEVNSVYEEWKMWTALLRFKKTRERK